MKTSITPPPIVLEVMAAPRSSGCTCISSDASSSTSGVVIMQPSPPSSSSKLTLPSWRQNEKSMYSSERWVSLKPSLMYAACMSFISALSFHEVTSATVPGCEQILYFSQFLMKTGSRIASPDLHSM